MTLTKKTNFLNMNRKYTNGQERDLLYVLVPRKVWMDSNFPFKEGDRLRLDIPWDKHTLEQILKEIDLDAPLMIISSIREE